MSLLIPDIGLVFWMTLSFGIVFFILAKWGFPVITRAVERRNDYIENSLEAARAAEEKLATLSKQADAILNEARGKQNELLSEAMELKKKILNEAKDTAEIEARKRVQRATAEIEEAKGKAMDELRGQVADISVRIAEKVLGEKLQNDEQQRRLIDRMLNEQNATKS